jgi:hypothetical protein
MTLLERLIIELNAAKIPFAVVGGVALALHGAPRGTVDIDLVIEHSQDNFIGVEKCLSKLGLVSRIPVDAREVFQFRKEYISKRNLIAWSFYSRSNPFDVVDIIITHDLSDMSRERRRLGLQTLYVVCIQDLIKMKVKSKRPQDLEDIKVLKELLK